MVLDTKIVIPAIISAFLTTKRADLATVNRVLEAVNVDWGAMSKGLVVMSALLDGVSVVLGTLWR